MGAYAGMLWHVVVQAMIVLFLVVAVSGLGVGIGLILSSQKTSQLFHSLNRWFSTRHALKAIEVPHETDRVAHRYQRWLAGGFVLGGLIAIFGLVAAVDVVALSKIVAEKRAAAFVAVILDCARWFLIVGSVAGVVVGAMLLFYPDAESKLEAFTNRWVSSRRVVRSWDDMHMTLDLLVEAHPTPAGWLLACTSAGAVFCAVFMLVRYY
ncbi:MAG TPA: hypothetical protein VLV56_17670 [Burkholderiales bacterium]|nr:hypothetical protein [Burkholderiales bacterium]